jgi:hypothetical protein
MGFRLSVFSSILKTFPILGIINSESLMRHITACNGLHPYDRDEHLCDFQLLMTAYKARDASSIQSSYIADALKHDRTYARRDLKDKYAPYVAGLKSIDSFYKPLYPHAKAAGEDYESSTGLSIPSRFKLENIKDQVIDSFARTLSATDSMASSSREELTLSIINTTIDTKMPFEKVALECANAVKDKNVFYWAYGCNILLGEEFKPNNSFIVNPEFVSGRMYDVMRSSKYYAARDKSISSLESLSRALFSRSDIIPLGEHRQALVRYLLSRAKSKEFNNLYNFSTFLRATGITDSASISKAWAVMRSNKSVEGHVLSGGYSLGSDLLSYFDRSRLSEFVYVKSDIPLPLDMVQVLTEYGFSIMLACVSLTGKFHKIVVNVPFSYYKTLIKRWSGSPVPFLPTGHGMAKLRLSE